MSDENRSHSVTVQFLVAGWGTDEDMDRRQALEERVAEALGDNGSFQGAGGGSGSMDVSFSVTDPHLARQAVTQLMDQIGDPDDTVVTYSWFSADEEEEEESGGEVWWPPNYPYEFGMFGPMWKGPLPAEELAKLSPELRQLQGMWRVVRYDADDGTQSSEWSEQLRFMFVRDIATVRHGMSVISHARMQFDPNHSPKHLDVYPIIGGNKGGVSLGVYELTADTFQFCSAGGDDPRPEALLPLSEHQVGRMVLQRVEPGA
jgi:uncharacterized protein (TIGR03067 family)